MERLRGFLKQNVLWVGLLLVLAPLLVNLGLQYRSLVELETNMPKARQAKMREFLSEVAWDVKKTYYTKAGGALDVPASAFNPTRESVIAAHFAGKEFKGAKRLFVGTVGPEDSRRGIAQILFYNSKGRKLERCPDSPEWGAAHTASANWIAMSLTGTTLKSPQLSVDERDPKHRIVVKPIVDDDWKVVGVAGMVLDPDVFKTDYLPKAINDYLPRFFPHDAAEVVVTLRDGKKQVIFANQPDEGKPHEAYSNLSFIFTDWYLGMRMRGLTQEELATRNFTINLSLALVTTLILAGGIIFAMRAASRAMKLSQMKADFVSNVSHELRTPLASIRVFGEFLKLGRVNDPGKVSEYGEYIETESRRLTQLINNILDFSKIESGQKTYQFERADVGRVVAETLKTFEVRLEQSGFRIDYSAPDRPLPPALVDPDAIAQALINLLDNAVKYSGKAKEIEVGLGQRDGLIEVAVTDHGVGISREEREKIFEKFYRVSTGLVHDVKGSGLGLSIVKHVVEAHRGRVTVESEPGKGSTFTMSLPADGGARDNSETRPGRESVGGQLLNSGSEV